MQKTFPGHSPPIPCYAPNQQACSRRGVGQYAPAPLWPRECGTVKQHKRMERIRALQAPSSVKTTLVILSVYANYKNQCWPSLGVIAETSGLTLRTIQRSLRYAERMGWIATAARFGRSNLITMTLPPVPRGDTVAGGGDTLSPRTVKNYRQPHCHLCNVLGEPCQTHRFSKPKPLIN